MFWGLFGAVVGGIAGVVGGPAGVVTGATVGAAVGAALEAVFGSDKARQAAVGQDEDRCKKQKAEVQHKIAAVQAVLSSALASTAGGRSINLVNAATAPPGTKIMPASDLGCLLLARKARAVKGMLEKKGYAGLTDIAVDMEDFFYPPCDSDLTDVQDTSNTFRRGGEDYARPCGWKRKALNVVKLYGDDMKWVGKTGTSDSGEWPVSYHGTKKDFVSSIVTTAYQAGRRAAYGEGVYSTPHIHAAERYAGEFEENGQLYKVVLQNRANPEYRVVHDGWCGSPYWVIPDGCDMKENIRPYHLLIKKYGPIAISDEARADQEKARLKKQEARRKKAEIKHKIAAVQAVLSSTLASTAGGRSIKIVNAATAPPGTKTMPVSDFGELLLARDADVVEELLKTKGYAFMKDIAVDMQDFFYPSWDVDFTDIHDTPNSFSRGGEDYIRPCGWTRYTLNIFNMYGGDMNWVGTTGLQKSGEWPVSYHTNNKRFASSVVQTSKKTGSRAKFGKGVYSTPDPHAAEEYAVEFEENRKKYKVMVQDRVNPKHRQVYDGMCGSPYWVIPAGYDTKENIRPYHLLVKNSNEDLHKKDERRRKLAEDEAHRRSEEEHRKQQQEALRKKQEEEEHRKQQQEALRKKQEEEEHRKQQQEALRKKQEADRRKKKESAVKHNIAAVQAALSSTLAATVGGSAINIVNAATAPPGTRTMPLNDYWDLLLARDGDVVEEMLKKKGYAGLTDIAVEMEDFFDPQWDFDFTNVKDAPNSFSRGGEKYARPCGWNRKALNVGKKYGTDQRWLGNTGSLDSGEWPVSYHGTKKTFVADIVKTAYKTGSGCAYGRGVYSTPDVSIAKAYASEYTEDGQTYKVVLQNRVNPEHRKLVNDGKYWVIPEGCDMNGNIRPYGILIKKC